MRNGRGIGRRVQAAGEATRRSGGRRRAIAGAPLLTLAGAAVLAGGNAAPQVQDVTVDVTQLRNAKGDILACLTSSRKHFPDCEGDAAAFEARAAARNGARITFRNVPAGTYAIALLHDENANGKADRALMMMPKEGFGFSRDAKLKMGPPSFSSASFEVADAPVRQRITMRYLF